MADLSRFRLGLWQKPLNGLMKAMLRSPALAWAPGRFLLLVHVVGRKSGREFDVPVAYARQGDDLLIGSPFGWTANLRTDDEVGIRLYGRAVTAVVQRFDDEERAVPILAEMCRRLPTFRAFMRVRLDSAGEPDLDAVREARAAGVRAFRLTPK